MAGHIAATAAPARRDSRLLSMTSPSTSSATALGCARSVTSEHLSLHHIIRSESDLDSALALRDAQRTVHHPHIADGLPRRNRFRGACLRRIVTFSQTCATWGWTSSRTPLQLHRATAATCGYMYSSANGSGSRP